MQPVVRMVSRFLADERGSAALEYATLSLVTCVASVGIGSQLREAQALAHEAFLNSFDEALEDALIDTRH